MAPYSSNHSNLLGKPLLENMEALIVKYLVLLLEGLKTNYVTNLIGKSLHEFNQHIAERPCDPLSALWVDGVGVSFFQTELISVWRKINPPIIFS